MGRIDFVRQGPFLLLQFNSSCNDALPICQAACCRLRKYYSVHLTEEEATRLECTWTATKDGGAVALLDGTAEGDCVYLKDSRCSIWDERPQDCRNWHCSPQGGLEDPEITRRENGWVLFPAREAK